MSTRENTAFRILIVDDVAEVLDALEKLVRADGYLVDTARSEDSAIQCAQRTAPNAILLNVDVSRDELIVDARRLRARARLSEAIPIILFCVDWLQPGEEIEIGDNIHATQLDNFNQLRRLLARLIQS